ncbi:MAG: DNA-directed RNA polymerase subunit alpha [Thermodesulfovibrio sp.]|uniref:DNA-directed RNA polymerase subunit alpha n=2 Tax=Thermodesulfovibrio TaxID=28261 RepID=A0A2J6WKI0_9BACT|nr:MAG: DNA-directed RNA polymerase subunit alpha [Thermodesulfovibrio aggregans]
MSLYKEFQMPKKVEFEQESLTDTYGKLIIEPLERGYGITLGNSLRRVLLSSLEGAAVYAIKINGVLHEFSSIKGVKEDILDIVLNVKKLRFKYYSQSADKKIATINVKGPAEVTAEAIQTDGTYEILNKSQYICSLDQDASLEMTLYLTKGRGYVPSEAIKDEDLPVDAITIDAIFSPIKKVNFRVEKTRVGELTDYDRLILEIWTDGSMTPERAISEASNILINHFEYLRFFKESEVQNNKSEEGVTNIEEDLTFDTLNENIFKPIEDLELSVRAYNCLKSAGINTIAELVQKNENELLKTKNFGKRSLEEIKEVLNTLGLKLGMRINQELLEKFKEKVQRG